MSVAVPIRTRVRSVAPAPEPVRVRTRSRVVEAESYLPQQEEAIAQSLRWGDPTKPIWEIMASHKTMSGLTTGDSLHHGDTEEEVRELFEAGNRDYEITSMEKLEGYLGCL